MLDAEYFGTQPPLFINIFQHSVNGEWKEMAIAQVYVITVIV